MKNTFKLMGLALLAGTLMFTACKDEPEVEPAAPAQTFSVNFNGQMCPMGEVQASTDEAFDYFMVAGATDTIAMNNLTIMSAFKDLEDAKGKWTKDDVDIMYCSSIERATIDSVLGIFGEYMTETVSEFTHESFDATKLTLTTSATATLASYWEYLQGAEPEDCTRANITVSASNIPLAIDEEVDAKANIAKKVALKK